MELVTQAERERRELAHRQEVENAVQQGITKALGELSDGDRVVQINVFVNIINGNPHGGGAQNVILNRGGHVGDIRTESE